MPWIIGGALLGGALLSSNSNKTAAQTAANAQIASTQTAAQAAKFTPVGVTTRYGSSDFKLSPSGELIGAGYTVSPELQGYQNRLQGLTERGLGQAAAGEAMLRPNIGAAESLFSLGNQYLAQSPEQTAQKYMESQYNLLAPSRERQYAQLQNQLFQTGRGGLSVGGTGLRPSGGEGLRASNPELESYYNSLNQQDLQLAQQAEQAGQQRTAFGTGLFNTGNQLLNQYYSGQVNALNPFTTYLGAGSTIESLGQQPLDIGAQLGGRAATAGANVGASLLQGGLASARTQQAAAGSSGFGSFLTGAASNPQLISGIQNYITTTPTTFGAYSGGGVNSSNVGYNPAAWNY